MPLPAPRFAVSLNTPSDFDKIRPYLEAEGVHIPSNIYTMLQSMSGITVREHHSRDPSLRIRVSSDIAHIVEELDLPLFTVDEFLASFQSLSNEEIFAQFLKQHRKFSAFKRYVDTYFSAPVRFALFETIIWRDTTEGEAYWSNLDNQWVKLVNHFNLQGTIERSKLLSIP